MSECDCKCKKAAMLIIEEQIPIIRKMLQDETWYEGVRRNAPVDPNDPAVQKRVGELIMEHGAKMRKEAMDRLAQKGVKLDE